jgi:uncharacterized protein (UPF0332 family)
VSRFRDKAREAARSSRVLLEAADPNGAVNRAYYAMFHVARAALGDIDPELAITKRHATVIGRFARYMVKERGLDAELGRAFSLAFDLRIIADYHQESVDPADAREVIQGMETFLEAVANIERGSGE